MNYEVEHKDNWFHFYDRATKFSFHYYVNNHLFFIDKFRKDDKHSYMDLFLEEKEYLVPEFQSFFEKMFEYAKELGCYSVFTPLVSRFSLYKFKKYLKLENLDIERKRDLNNIHPWFTKDQPYHYHDLIENYVSDIIYAYIIFNYHVLRDLKNNIECFHCEDHSHHVHCDGYDAEFHFEIRSDGLYAIEKSLKMDVKIEREIKDTIEKLMPYVDKMKKKGKLTNFFTDKFFFAEKSFRRNNLSLIFGKSGCFSKVIDFLLQHYSKRELELHFWKDLNFKGRAISRFVYDAFPEDHFKILGFCFITNFKTGEVSIYHSETEYNKAIKNNKKKAI